ncbi:hypothetical protein JZ751_001830, partial [Albula glossodonta]
MDLKYQVLLPVATGALLFGIPYSISLVAQWMYGWPHKAGYKKYIEAGIAYGRRNNKLDLYYCSNTDQSGGDPTPVVLFVYGGAWGSGGRAIYCLLASQMAKELNAVV